MPRNTELIRQWAILREIDAARYGISVQKLAAEHNVHQRTIRRDIEALVRAGFPLRDERINGTAMWKLTGKPFKQLEEAGLGVTELCALYFSRSMLEALAGAPFLEEAERAFGKLERALPPASRKYLSRFPGMLKAKASGRKKQDERKARDILSRAVDAALRQRRVKMMYHSASSRRVKEYIVEPLRLSYAHGGIYLIAWVPEYGQVRTFAIERVRTLAVLDEHFEPRPLPPEPFANSMGVHTGPGEPIELEVDARVADYVRERDWHPSQQIEERPDGSLLLRLCVCVDPPLRSWILSFGPLVKVVAPGRLAAEIFEEIEEARDLYLPRLIFETARAASDSRQARLPLSAKRWRKSEAKGQ